MLREYCSLWVCLLDLCSEVYCQERLRGYLVSHWLRILRGRGIVQDNLSCLSSTVYTEYANCDDDR